VGRRDLLVVGGGPAGLAVAIFARQAGLAVTVLERARPPIDRGCGEGLLPDAVARLEALGAVPDPGARASFLGIRYLAEGLTAEGRFPGGPAWGVRRTVLHSTLARRAAEAGADLRWGVAPEGLTPGGVVTGSGVLEAAVVVGADGRNSAVRRWAGLDGRPGRPHRHAVRRHFEVGPWTDLVEVHWAEQAEAYVTPVGARQVGVALLWNGGPASFDAVLCRFPALTACLAGAPPVSRDRGASRFGARPRGVVAGGVALVGDAAGSVDPITGEGLSLALRGAEALVAAVVAGDLAGYARAHRRLVRGPRAMARVLLLLERRERLRRNAIAALGDDPALFSRLLAFHSGALPARAVGLGPAARLVARALLATPRSPGVPRAA
jgi:flavin-dependent dehydrogenase